MSANLWAFIITVIVAVVVVPAEAMLWGAV